MLVNTFNGLVSCCSCIRSSRVWWLCMGNTCEYLDWGSRASFPSDRHQTTSRLTFHDARTVVKGVDTADRETERDGDVYNTMPVLNNSTFKRKRPGRVGDRTRSKLHRLAQTNCSSRLISLVAYVCLCVSVFVECNKCSLMLLQLFQLLLQKLPPLGRGAGA